MDATLDEFARATRQPALCGANRTALARKWLALKIAPPALGVASRMLYVGNDYGLMALRLTNSDVGEQCGGVVQTHDIQAFVEIMAEGFKDAPPLEDTHHPDLLAFRDAIFPRPLEEEAWVPYSRRDHWRDRAYFVAAQLPAVHQELVSAIHGWGLSTEQRKERAHLDEAADIYARINAYHASVKQVPRVAVAATSALLKELVLGDVEPELVEQEEVQGGPECAEQLQAYQEEERKKVEVIFSPAATSVAAVAAGELERTPAMRAYADEALVNATFCNYRLAKQMLLLQLGKPLEGSELLSRNQRVLSASVDVPRLEPEALDALCAPLSDLPALNKQSEQVQALYAACGEPPVSVAAFLRTALDVYGAHPEAEVELWKSNILKQWHNIDESIVKCVLSL